LGYDLITAYSVGCLMNKTLAISAIALVAVIMGLSTIAPGLQQAFADDVKSQRGAAGTGACPDAFFQLARCELGLHPDHNFNALVCVKTIGGVVTITTDDLSGPPSPEG